MNPIKKTITLADGREITLETGKLAKQADGAVELRMGNTMLLATVVSAKEAGEGVDLCLSKLSTKRNSRQQAATLEVSRNARDARQTTKF